MKFKRKNVQMCACGCGKEVKKGKKFLHGHNRIVWTEEMRSKASKRMEGNDHFLGKKHTKETKRKISESKSGIPLSEEHKNKIGDANRGRKMTEENVEKLRIRMMGNSYTMGRVIPEEEKIIKSKKLRGRVPTEKERMNRLKNLNSTETCVKRFENARRGPDHPNWCGGTSNGNYCNMWKDKWFKSEIRDRDNNKCLHPGCDNSCPKTRMVHHIDYDKLNCHLNNLVCLCNSCHSKTNAVSKRKQYTDLFRKILNEKYGYKYE